MRRAVILCREAASSQFDGGEWIARAYLRTTRAFPSTGNMAPLTRMLSLDAWRSVQTL